MQPQRRSAAKLPTHPFRLNAHINASVKTVKRDLLPVCLDQHRKRDPRTERTYCARISSSHHTDRRRSGVDQGVVPFGGATGAPDDGETGAIWTSFEPALGGIEDAPGSTAEGVLDWLGADEPARVLALGGATPESVPVAVVLVDGAVEPAPVPFVATSLVLAPVGATAKAVWLLPAGSLGRGGTRVCVA